MEVLYFSLNPTSPIVFSCYGTGDLPRIDGTKEQLSTLTWTDNGDGTWTTPVTDPTISIPNIWFDGVLLSATVDIGSLAAATDEHWYSDRSVGTLSINIDPITISSLRYAEHSMCFASSTGSTNLIYSYLDITGFRDRSLVLGGSGIVENCKLGEYTNYGIVCGSNTIIRNNIIDSNEPYYRNANLIGTHLSGGYEGIRVATRDTDNSGCKIYNNTVKNFRHASLVFNCGTSTITSVGGEVYNNVFVIDSKSLQYGGGLSIQGKGNSINIHDNAFIRVKSLQVEGDDHIITNNLFYKNINSNSSTKTYNTGHGITTNIGEAAGMNNLSITGNVFYKCDGSAFRSKGSNVGPLDNITFSGNVTYDCGQLYPVYASNLNTGVAFQIDTGTLTYQVTNVNFDNNVIFSSTTEKTITISTESDLNTAGAYSTVDELAASTPAEFASFSGNSVYNVINKLEV